MSIDPYRAPDSSLGPKSYGSTDLWDTMPAPHGKRWLASFLDNMFILIPLLVILVGGGVMIGMTSDSGDIGPLGDLLGLLFQFAAVGGQIVYGTVFESSDWHATPGKRLLGLEVVHEDGEYLSFAQALGRNAAKFVGLTMCGLIAFTVLMDDAHRGLWDRMASSRVVVRTPYA